jgi:hypothetical protein
MLTYIAYVNIVFDSYDKLIGSTLMTSVTRSEIRQMRQLAGPAVTVLRALANENRLMLLAQLTRAEMCAKLLRQNQPHSGG